MKNKNHLISGLLLSLLIGAQMLAVPAGLAQAPAPDITPAEQQLINDALAADEQETALAKKKAEEEAAAEALKVCTDAGYKDCTEFDKAVQNTSGQGFKLNLDAFTLTSDGKKQGQAIFNNTDYSVAKYGPIVATLLRVIDILVKLIGSFAMLTLITAGIFMIANHGDEAWVTKGKGMMLYSILGILFALLSYALVNVVQSALA